MSNNNKLHNNGIVVADFKDEPDDIKGLELCHSNVTPSRRTSSCSQQSYPESNLSMSSPINYDSGNFSVNEYLNNSLRPTSFSSAEDDQFSPSSLNQDILLKEQREKDQFLFLAMQDLRKFKSELERLGKSEKWYKNELKLQKRSKLEILEKLYLNERTFLRENKKLKSECEELQSMYKQVERKSLYDQNQSIECLNDQNEKKRSSQFLLDEKQSPQISFEMGKLRSTLEEQTSLIDVLRKQKHSLLNDLRSVTATKNSEIILLEQEAAGTQDQQNRMNSFVITEQSIGLEQHTLGIKIDISNINDNSKLSNDKKLASFNKHDLAEFNEKLKDKTTEIERLLMSESNLKKIILSLQADLSTNSVLRDQIQLLKLQLKTGADEMEKLSSLNSTQTLEIQQSECNLIAAQTRITNTKNENALLTEKYSNVDRENQRILRNNLCIQEDITDKIDDLNCCRKELAAVEKIVETQREEISIMVQERNSFQNLQKNYQHISRQFEEKASEVLILSTAKEELEKLRETFQLTNTELTNLRSELESRNMNLSELKSEALIKTKTIEGLQLICRQQHAVIKKLNGESVARETATYFNIEASEHKIDLLKALLGQQSGKVSQLHQQQEEWQELLETLNATQKIMHETSNELYHKNHETEMLNRTLQKQSEKIQKLESASNEGFLLPFGNDQTDLMNDPTEDILVKREHELVEKNVEIVKLNEKCRNQEIENATMKMFYKNLEKNNDHLLKIKSLEQNLEFKENEIKMLIAEKIYNEKSCSEHCQLMKNLKNELNLNSEKINNLNMKLARREEVCPNCEIITQEKQDLLRNLKKLDKHSTETETDNIIVIASTHSKLIEDLKQAKLLNSVIETEHKKKIARYEVHIRTLLGNVKSHKKNLEIVESQYGKLLEKCELLELENNKYVLSKNGENKFKYMTEKDIIQLEEITQKYEESQQTINILKSQLETVQNQFKDIDLYKRLNSNLHGSLSNLMNDYKKIIHQTIPVPSTLKSKFTIDYNSIYDLIEKSNNYVPNFNSLSQSITELKCNIENIQLAKERIPLWPSMINEKRKSLMDELKEVLL